MLRLLERQERILKARQSLDDWARVAGYEPALHHQLINRHLADLASGAGKPGLMIFMPPGSAKSTYGSQLFPPWYLSQNPHHSVLAASHSETLAERWGRRARNLIEEHHATLGIEVDPNNRSASRWQLSPRPGTDDVALQMGEYLAAGAGSAIAGFRGDLGLIDDPVRGREQVESEAQREKLWEWYVYDFRPRLKPGAKQVMILTRWHMEDLAGRALAEDPEFWHVLSLPMIAERVDDPLGRQIGERLWPEWYTEQMVEIAKRDPQLWNSLYQQRPTAEQGTYWQRSWLHAVPPSQIPPLSRMRIYGGSDYAVSADRGDYTVHAVMGLDPEDRPWLLDLWRERASSDVWVDAWCILVKHYKPMGWGEEHGQIISGVGPFLEREQLRQRAFTDRRQFVSRADKGVRAQSIRGHIATHGLWYSTDLPYRAEMEAELLAFPNGPHDDIHDALGVIGQLLDVALSGDRPAKPDIKKVVGYRTVGQAQPSNLKVL